MAIPDVQVTPAEVREIVLRELRNSDLAVLVRQLQGRRLTYLTGADSGFTTSTTYVGAPPDLVVPFDGTFLVLVQAHTDGATHVSATGAGFTASDTDGFYTPVEQTGHGMFSASLTGGQTLSLAFRSVDGGSRHLRRSRIALVPL